MRDPYIDAIVEEQTKFAVEALKKPRTSQDMGYEYGYVAGIYAGLEMAKQRILALYRDEKEDKFE